jgi:hypothetical protein
MSKNSLVVAVKPTKKMGWCVFLNREPYAVGSYAYCNAVAQGLMLRYLQHGPASIPYFTASKGGAA